MSELEVGYATHRGRLRPSNEDSLLVRRTGDGYLLAVADGMGGHAAGEVASRMALVELEESVRAAPPSASPLDILKAAIKKANAEICSLARENAGYRGMGTTLVAALVSAGGALIANVGDSRAYLIDDGIAQVTRDHSLVRELVEQGAIAAAEAGRDPRKNIVTRALGVEGEVQADIFEVALGDRYLLLCSDGLTDALGDAEIRDTVVSAAGAEEACRRLVSAANEKGGRDNVSVVLARGKGD